MENDRRQRALAILSLAISATLFAIALCSCNTQYVPVESVRYDSIFLAKIQKDSIFVQDSVYIHQKGDTVFKDKFKIIYKSVFIIDTMLTVRKDSIPVPVPVEKKRTWWEQTKIDIASIAIRIVSIVLLYFLIRWIIKRTRKE